MELDNLVRKLAFNAVQVEQEVTFETLNMPTHTVNDILDFDRDNPPTQEADKMEVLQKENKQLWDTVEFLLKANGNIPKEGMRC